MTTASRAMRSQFTDTRIDRRGQHESWLWLLRVLIGALVLSVVGGADASAQVDAGVRDRVVSAAVMIGIVVEVIEDGVAQPIPIPVGSGTVVSPQGHILTNAHVVDMVAHEQAVDAWRKEAADQGQRISFDLIEDAVLVFVSDGENAPQPRYIAQTVASDAVLDLAVLQIVADGDALVAPGSLDLPFVPLGDSDSLKLGDPVSLFGYPDIAGSTLTYTQGVVSGFLTDGAGTRLWINTDATMAGGSSGGTAVDSGGRLVGIPTRGSSLDCRLADMNQDGRIDTQDVGCVPTGGSIGQLRPINLAAELLAGAGLQDEQSSALGTVDTARHTGVSMPQMLPIAHSTCFRIEQDTSLSFDDLLERLGGTDDAKRRIQEWGWQTSTNRIFACDSPPDGEAGWIDISLHVFGDPAAAQEAVDYFAAIRAEGTSLTPGPPPPLGEHAVALAGPASNGSEFTIYASQGPVLLRVTGVSPSGIPFSNVLTVAPSILAGQQEPPPPSTTVPSVLPASAYLPASPAVNHAECFRVLASGTYSYGEVADALQPTGLTRPEVDRLGWLDGAYIVFVCNAPPSGRASQIDVVIHRFRDGSSAQQALPYFSTTYAPGANESRSCDSADSLVICVTGRSLSGSPLSDVQFVLQQVLAAAR
jgi:S1-C subfamily serine protease